MSEMNVNFIYGETELPQHDYDYQNYLPQKDDCVWLLVDGEEKCLVVTRRFFNPIKNYINIYVTTLEEILK